ncbi:MAG: hypothetical protein ACYDCL_05745 [Myxococcales bacterium]
MFAKTGALGIIACACGAGKSRPAPINHRPNDAQCSTPAGPGSCGCSDGGSCSGAEFQCTGDSSCTQGVNGRCDGNGPIAGCSCNYDQCSGDGDCPSNETCACHGSPYKFGGNACIPGNCRVDSDCGDGGYRSPSPDFSVVGYFCHTPQDACSNDGDCTPENSGPSCEGSPRCSYSSSAGHWQCQCVVIPL